MIAAIVDRLGMQGILPVYGMTETTSITTIPRLDDPPERITSGTGFPVSDFELKVVDTDSGEELGAGTRGRGLRPRPPRHAGLLRGRPRRPTR